MERQIWALRRTIAVSALSALAAVAKALAQQAEMKGLFCGDRRLFSNIIGRVDISVDGRERIENSLQFRPDTCFSDQS
ncbi:hypothetical protein [Deinococcus marmoris]|uniref:hypothetical protein n=1 Tax=Deinococcus marmoris TaxID=249408 RepID=UPI00096A853A|nr:hypothetical protein [Deinococcus marmoris]